MNKLWDAHMHTDFSGDSTASVSEMLSASKELSLCGVTITDHLDWDYPEEPGLFDLDIPRYIDTILRISKESSTPDFKINMGIELGLQSHLVPRHNELLKSYDFDFVIGSIHVVNGRDPYYDAYFEHRSPRECYVEYLDTMLSNIELFHNIDALGHLDYICRYAVPRFGMADSMMNYNAYEELLSAILGFIISHDIALEVNTGSIRLGFPDPNPSYEIISHYKEMGGRLITLGADAHKPAHIAKGFSDMRDHLKELGFDSYVVYTKRKPEEYPL